MKRISSVKHHNRIDRQKSEVASKFLSCFEMVVSLSFSPEVQEINLPPPKPDPAQGPIVSKKWWLTFVSFYI